MVIMVTDHPTARMKNERSQDGKLKSHLEWSYDLQLLAFLYANITFLCVISFFFSNKLAPGTGIYEIQKLPATN